MSLTSLLRPSVNNQLYWGRYEYLNKNPKPDTNFLDIQLQHLSAIQRSSQRYQDVAMFLNRALGTMPEEEHAKFETTMDERIEGAVIQFLNAALWGSSLNPARAAKEGSLSGNWKSAADDTIVQLRRTLQRLRVSPSGGITKAMLQTFSNQIRGTQRLSNAEYTQEKAQYAEQLAVQLLSKDKTLTAIQTGQFVDAAGQQIIEDALVFKDIKQKLGNGLFAVTITSKQDKSKISASVRTVADFVKLSKKYSKDYTISLTDDLYAALQEARAFAVQVKSGMNVQPILNEKATTRNALTLGSIDVSEVLNDLYELRSWLSSDSDQHSETVSLWANYDLSRNIAHTSLNFNELYFTEDGFITAAEWMFKHNRILAFHPGIFAIGADFYTRSRPYRFIAT